MSNIAIEFNNVGKMYRLGRVGTGTLSHDLNRWWTMNVLRKEDPFLKIGETNDRSKKGHSDYVWALRDISFKVEQGDVVGIIGKNGAGKSTLLKLLSRITSPSTGSIRYQGRIASLLEVGTGFHPEMTGRENIYMNGSIMGMTKKEITRKLDEIVDFAGVERYLDTPVKRYSSGMTVRLGFAVAAFLEPEILVVDEVLTVGDAEFQKKAIGKMQDVSQGGGRTVLFVSHNMASVRRLCTKGIVLKDGGLAYQGGTDDAIDFYLQSSLTDTIDVPIEMLPRLGRSSGKMRFNSLDFFNFDNEPYSPHSGNPLRIRVGFFVYELSGISDVRISIEIRDQYGAPLMYFPSHLLLNNMSFSEGQHYVSVDIEKFPLSEGSYKIMLWADCKQEISDWIDGIIPMNVEDDDFFDKGQEVPKHLRGKIVLYDHKWSVD